MSKKNSKSETEIPMESLTTNPWVRGFKLAKWSLKAGFDTIIVPAAKKKFGRLQQSTSEVMESAVLALIETHAQELATEFGKLKGSVMKAGQMLAMYGEHFFPPHINLILRKLYKDSPPVAWSIIQKSLKKQLAPERLALLEVSRESIGTASLGQVHTAVIIQTGQKICLKVQYPGISKAIGSDLAFLKLIFKAIKISGAQFDPVFDEVKTMLRSELDYRAEARSTQNFKELLNGDNRYAVPSVIDDFCTNKLIATEFMDGVDISTALIETLSQQQRNFFAQAALDLFFREFFEWGTVQTDPHFGNYKIRLLSGGFDCDQLVLLDFGAVRTFSKLFLKTYYRMFLAALDRRPEDFIHAAIELGLTTSRDTQDETHFLYELSQIILEPFRELEDGSLYDWGSTSIGRRVSRLATTYVFSKEFVTPPRELLFLDRKLGGVYIFLTSFKAQLNGFKILSPFLERIRTAANQA